MEIEIKLHVKPMIEGGPVTLFTKLVMMTQIAGQPLGPITKQEMHDIYYDTPEGALTAAGAGLRLRIRNGAPFVTLKVGRYQDGALTQREEFEEPLDQERLDWVLSHVANLIGSGPYPADSFRRGKPCGPLHPIVEIGTARMVRPIGRQAELALDMVEYPGLTATPYFDIEVEGDGPQSVPLLRRVESELYALAGGNLAPAAMTKLERGLNLLARAPS